VKASERVVRALEADWVPACDGLVALSANRARRSANEPEHTFLTVLAGERHIQVSLSPTGRSVRVYVDGAEVRRARDLPAPQAG